mmetsp:Transcript_5677/g.35318  ORF Transcript_5677/g.35318 Transcript_5677/m.35318 type:complete len:292 (-) Transcript_5677:479-1354(-)
MPSTVQPTREFLWIEEVVAHTLANFLGHGAHVQFTHDHPAVHLAAQQGHLVYVGTVCEPALHVFSTGGGLKQQIFCFQPTIDCVQNETHARICIGGAAGFQPGHHAINERTKLRIVHVHWPRYRCCHDQLQDALDQHSVVRQRQKPRESQHNQLFQRCGERIGLHQAGQMHQDSHRRVLCPRVFVQDQPIEKICKDVLKVSTVHIVRCPPAQWHCCGLKKHDREQRELSYELASPSVVRRVQFFEYLCGKSFDSRTSHSDQGVKERTFQVNWNEAAQLCQEEVRTTTIQPC